MSTYRRFYIPGASMQPGRSGMLFMPDTNIRKMSGNEKMLPDLQGLIRGTLKDPDSAEFKNSFVSRLIGAPVVCGYVNAKNAFGGYTGFERFISGGSIQVVESQMAAGEMNKTWRTVCGQ